MIKKGLEDRCGIEFSSNHPIMSWLVEHAADTISKFHAGQDGRTAYERWKGKSFKEFGEVVHCKHNRREKRGNMEMKWDEGIYLGSDMRTGEAVMERVRQGGKTSGSASTMGW